MIEMRAWVRRRHAGSVAWIAALAIALTACGSNAPEIPPELIEAIKASGTGNGSDYPAGPFGTSEGDVVTNLCFDGWRNPKAAGYDSSAFEQICFSDFYAPEGTTLDPEGSGEERNVELILVNTGAVWCSACQVEWGGLGSHPPLSVIQEERQEDGLQILGLIFQDAARKPATEVHAEAWSEKFEVDVPFALDPDFLMGLYAKPDTQPFNMVVDARTMQILLQVEGDNPTVLLAFIDEELAKRAAAQ
jgi:hypothetical protein